MFENLFEEANSIIKRNEELETDNYILESDIFDEVEFTENLEEIQYTDEHEEVIVESIEDYEILGLMEYEDMDFDDEDHNNYGASDDEEHDFDDEDGDIFVPDADADNYEEDDENGEEDDWLEESWIFESVD